MNQGVRTLLSGLIDYAGLFPPAGLSMADAAAEFNRQRLGEHAFALNRFVCPASRLEELSRDARMLMPGTYATSGYREMAGPGMSDPWEVSAVVDVELGAAIAAIDAFNEHHAAEDRGLARVAAVELKAERAADIDDALEGIPSALLPYFEIPIDGDCRGMVAALAGQEGVGAKVRCGGVRPEAIPPSAQIAGFLAACAAAGVAFKATAGLHHPIRAEHALTYEAGGPRGVMHGFVNVFVAAALARAGRADAATLTAILDESDASAFRVDDRGASWRGVWVDLVGLANARERFALGYGSCSFAEPIDDLRRLGWA